MIFAAKTSESPSPDKSVVCQAWKFTLDESKRLNSVIGHWEQAQTIGAKFGPTITQTSGPTRWCIKGIV